MKILLIWLLITSTKLISEISSCDYPKGKWIPFWKFENGVINSGIKTPDGRCESYLVYFNPYK